MPSGSCSVPSRWPVCLEYPDWETCPGPRVGCSVGVLLGQVSWRSPPGKLRATEGGVGTREGQVRAGHTFSRGKHSLKQTHHISRWMAALQDPSQTGRAEATWERRTGRLGSSLFFSLNRRKSVSTLFTGLSSLFHSLSDKCTLNSPAKPSRLTGWNLHIVHPRQKQKMGPSGEDSGCFPSIF